MLPPPPYPSLITSNSSFSLSPRPLSLPISRLSKDLEYEEGKRDEICLFLLFFVHLAPCMIL